VVELGCNGREGVSGRGGEIQGGAEGEERGLIEVWMRRRGEGLGKKATSGLDRVLDEASEGSVAEREWTSPRGREQGHRGEEKEEEWQRE
jgi:hypothetical protein